MARPAQVHVLEAHERDNGDLELWVDFGGTEVHLLVCNGAITDRKLAYGFAHAERVSKHEHVVVDADASADQKALEAIFAEHLDRWGRHGVGIGDMDNGERPPHRPSNVPRTGITRRRDLEKPHRPPKKAPQIAPKPIVVKATQ